MKVRKSERKKKTNKEKQLRKFSYYIIWSFGDSRQKTKKDKISLQACIKKKKIEAEMNTWKRKIYIYEEFSTRLQSETQVKIKY